MEFIYNFEESFVVCFRCFVLMILEKSLVVFCQYVVMNLGIFVNKYYDGFVQVKFGVFIFFFFFVFVFK